MAPAWFKEHFSLKQLSLLHDVPTLFIVSQWQTDKSRPHAIYLIYRMLLVIFLITTWIISFFVDSDRFWAAYLTNWGYTMCNLQALIAFLMVLSAYVTSPKAHKLILKMHSVYWIAHSAATSIGFTITITYWSLIATQYPFTTINFFLHGVNSMILLADLFIVAHPVRILHFIYPAIYGIAYLILTIAYYYYDTNRGGPGYIYTVLDWDKPGTTTALVIGVLVLTIFMHFLAFAIYKLRIRIHEKLHPEENNTQSREQLSRVV